MKVIICAAGVSNRMGTLTKKFPKPLLNINNTTIIKYIIENVAVDPIKEIGIVVGYRAKQIEKQIGYVVNNKKIVYIKNPKYRRKSNTYSLYFAKDLINKGLLFTNGDSLHTPKTYKRFISDKRQNLVAVDNNPKYFTSNDPVKVTVKNNRITAINKKLPLNKITGVAVGLYKLSPNTTNHFFNIISDIITKYEPKEGYAEPMRRLIMDKIVRPYYIDDEPWLDIDTPRDYRKAKFIFQNNNKL